VLNRAVTDELTGTVWHRDANPAEFPLTWNEAQAYVADMRAHHAHGYTGWQLPSRGLLFSPVSHQHITSGPRPLEPFFHWTLSVGRSMFDVQSFLRPSLCPLNPPPLEPFIRHFPMTIPMTLGPV
jgi:hypothetical protein